MCRSAAPAHLYRMGLIPFLHTSIPAARCAAVPDGWGAALPYTPCGKSVTHAVSTKCYPCGEHVQVRALPVATNRNGTFGLSL